MDELFTPRAKAVLAIAQEEAKYFKHQSVGSEHLLLALIIEQEGIAGKVLREMNVQENDVREEIGRSRTRRSSWSPQSKPRKSNT